MEPQGEHVWCTLRHWIKREYFSPKDLALSLGHFFGKVRNCWIPCHPEFFSCWVVLFTSMLHKMIVFHTSILSIFRKLALVSVQFSDASGASVRKKVTSRPVVLESGCTEAQMKGRLQVLSNYSTLVWAPRRKYTQT